MARKLLRVLIALTTFVVVWLVAQPARAAESAPLCDARGAITFAPPPQIQDEERSIDIPVDCIEINLLETEHVAPGRAPPPDLSFSREPAAVGTPVVLAPTFEERVPLAPGTNVPLRAGVRFGVERPPRI
jgi:hypothetical protein